MLRWSRLAHTLFLSKKKKKTKNIFFFFAITCFLLYVGRDSRYSAYQKHRGLRLLDVSILTQQLSVRLAALCRFFLQKTARVLPLDERMSTLRCKPFPLLLSVTAVRVGESSNQQQLKQEHVTQYSKRKSQITADVIVSKQMTSINREKLA